MVGNQYKENFEIKTLHLSYDMQDENVFENLPHNQIGITQKDKSQLMSVRFQSMKKLWLTIGESLTKRGI